MDKDGKHTRGAASARPLTDNQRAALRALAAHNGGRWWAGCGRGHPGVAPAADVGSCVIFLIIHTEPVIV